MHHNCESLLKNGQEGTRLKAVQVCYNNTSNTYGVYIYAVRMGRGRGNESSLKLLGINHILVLQCRDLHYHNVRM